MLLGYVISTEKNMKTAIPHAIHQKKKNLSKGITNPNIRVENSRSPEVNQIIFCVLNKMIFKKDINNNKLDTIF